MIASLSDLFLSGLVNGWAEGALMIVLKATLLLLLGGVVAVGLRRASAAERHLVWTLVIGTVLALPALSLLLPQWSVPLPKVELRSENAAPAWRPVGGVVIGASDIGLDPAVPIASPHVSATPVRETALPQRGVVPARTSTLGRGSFDASSATPPTAPSRAPSGFGFPESWLLGMWGAGMVLLIGRLLVGRIGVRRLAAHAHPVTDPAWTVLVSNLRRELGLRRPVRLLASEQATMPMTWGWLRPTVLLPVDADRWSVERRQVVLLHELAHVKRADCLTQTLTQLACALYWPHPGVWWAARRQRAERERACDDQVLDVGVAPSDYADHLIEVARAFRSPRLTEAAAVSMARPSQLEGRVLAILDAGRRRRSSSRDTGLLFGLLAICLILPLSAMRPGAQPPSAPVELPPALAASPAFPLEENSRQDFEWSDVVEPGQTVRIKGVNGGIRAELTGGREVEVFADKREGRRGDADDVRIEAVEDEDGVTFCAIYPSRDRANRCEADDDWNVDVQSNDTQVEWTVRLPAGVHFTGRTINGEIDAEAGANVSAHTVNGDVAVRAHGSAEAITVNGSVEAAMGTADRTDDLRFETVNGSITLLLPENAGAEIEAYTLNGEIDTDWPLEIERGRWVGRSAEGVIGGGGPELSLKTVNGSIRLRRDSDAGGWIMEDADHSEWTRADWEEHPENEPVEVEEYSDESEPLVVMEDQDGYAYLTGDERERRRSVEQLARNAPPHAAAEALERIAFGDPSERVQREATEALGGILECRREACAEAAPEVCRILEQIAREHPRRSIRAQAREELKEYGRARTVIVLDGSEPLQDRELASAAALRSRQESTKTKKEPPIQIDLDLGEAEMNQLIGRSVAAGLHAAEAALEAADFGRAVAELTSAATVEALTTAAEMTDDPELRRELRRAGVEVRKELARQGAHSHPHPHP